jgi:hypothetical protein
MKGASKSGMRKRDIELVTALAEGRLVDETAARALIDRSPRLREHYQTQRRVIEAMAQIPPVALTETERATLHRTVWGVLAGDAPSSATSAGGWSLRWGYAAVALLVVAGTVSVIGQLGGDNGSLLDEDRTSSQSPEGGESAAPLDGLGTPETTSAPHLAGDDLRAANFAVYADQARGGSLAEVPVYEMASEESSVAQCVEEAALGGRLILGTIEEEGTGYALVTADETVGPDSVIVFVDLDSCTIAYRDE